MTSEEYCIATAIRQVRQNQPDRQTGRQVADTLISLKFWSAADVYLEQFSTLEGLDEPLTFTPAAA